MDSDLPLLEISGEDDSLIQQTPTTFKSAAVGDTYFSISPLQVPLSSGGSFSNNQHLRHIAESIRHNVDPDRLNCSPPKCSNKENMSLNKLEGPKLSMDPLQMKRRKRSYNLRKSLAWDKAFFTDEGVLDRHELSIITGTNGKSHGEALSVINEEVSKSPYSGSSCKLNSGSSQQRKYGGQFSSQQKSPTSVKSALNSQVMQAVHLNNDSSCRRSGVKSGRCPRPLPSSSPANVHTIRNALKSAKKDSDLPNIPDHKPGPCSLPTTNNNCIPRTRQLKHNQIAPPTVNIQKGVSLASSSKNVTSTQNKAKSGPNCVPLAAKVSAQHFRESLAKSSLEVNALRNAQPSQVTKPTQSSEVNQNPVVPSNLVFSSDGEHRPSVVTGLLPHKTPMTLGNTAEIQKVKPSSLRMPSPSLGYFGQHITQPKSIPKATGLGSQKFVPNFMTLNARTTSTMHSDIPAKPITVGLSSSMQCSEVTTSSAATHKPIKSYLKINEVKSVDIPVLQNKSSDLKSSKLKLDGDIGTEDNIARHEKHKKIKEVACEVDITNQTLLERGTCKQLREDNHDRTIYTPSQNYRINLEISQCIPGSISELPAASVRGCEGTTSHQLGEKELQTYSLTHGINSELQSEIQIKRKEQKTLTVHNDRVNNCMQELSDPFVKQPEILKHYTCDANQVPDMECHGCKVSKDTTRNMGVTDSVGPSSSGTEQNRDDFDFSFSNQLSDQDTNTILHNLSTNSDLIDRKPQEHSDVSNTTNCKSKVSTSSENLELQSPCFGDEQSFQSVSELYSDKFLGKEADPSNGTVILENEVRKSESNVSKVSPILSPGRSQDGEFDINQVPEQPPVESQFDLAEISNSVKMQDFSTDTHFRHEVKLTGNANSSHVSTPFHSEESCSLVQSDQVSFNESDAHSLGNDANMEGVALVSCLDGPLKREPVEGLQNQCTGRTAEKRLLLRSFSGGGEAKNSQQLCEFQNLQRTNADGSGLDILTIKSDVKDSNQKVTASTEQFGEESNLSGLGIAFDQCSEDSLKSSTEKDPSASIKQSERDAKLNSVIIPPPNAVPFSDEWLAAVEAAGEDILTMKGGAVQHSPPDKSLPEPSPWSPVKRKTVEIGPFDCTKFTNTQPADL